MGSVLEEPIENWTVGGFIGDTVKATGSFISTPIVGLYNGIVKSPGSAISFLKKDDDNDHIYIPQGTKTLLGDDFESLYPSYEYVDMTNENGTQSKYIECTGSYATEMRSGNASSNIDIAYNNMSGDKVKAIYEITLLSKRYASEYSDDNPANNDAIAEAYAQKMSQYQNYCESNGIEWVDVMYQVSSELQTESYEYGQESKNIIHGKDSDGSRIVANRAHGMLRKCMPDGYEDKLIPTLSGKMSYEDTLDTEPKSETWFETIGEKFIEAVKSIKDKASNFHPFKSMGEFAKDYKDGLMVYYDTMGLKTNTADYANHMMNTASKDNDYAQRADAEFGDITSDNSQENQYE